MCFWGYAISSPRKIERVDFNRCVHLCSHYRKSALLSDLRDCQCKVKDLKKQLERAESAELEAKGAAHENRLALEAAESSLRDKTSSNKSVISTLQQTVNGLKAK